MPTGDFCEAVSTIRRIEKLSRDDPDPLGDDTWEYLEELLWAGATIVEICGKQTSEAEKEAFTYIDKLAKQIEAQRKEISIKHSTIEKKRKAI